VSILVDPGDEAPMTGTYEPIDATGKPVPMLVTGQQGKPLPNLPKGYRWRLMEPNRTSARGRFAARSRPSK
jgi:hypothetical protein